MVWFLVSGQAPFAIGPSKAMQGRPTYKIALLPWKIWLALHVPR